MPNNKLSSIEEIIQDARNGKIFIIVDDENRENEGDLVIASEFASHEAINFMAKYGRGLICLALTEARSKILNLPLMSPLNSSRHGTAFTISIEAREGVTTGISAQDRATTIKTAISPDKSSYDICSPGHIFPLVARNGGVLVRAGHTEAAVDIAKLAGLNESGVICEIMNEDGTMARLPDLYKFAAKHQLKIASIADLIAYRRKAENLVSCKIKSKINHKYGELDIAVYVSNTEYAEHIVLTKGPINLDQPVLVRMHSQDILADIIGDNINDKANLIDRALQKITTNNGILVLLRSPQKNKVSETLFNRDHKLHKKVNDKLIRDYGTGAQILKDLGVKKLKLLTNNPKAIIALDSFGLEITEYVNF